MTDTLISEKSTMAQVLKVFPGARRTLFRNHHIQRRTRDQGLCHRVQFLHRRRRQNVLTWLKSMRLQVLTSASHRRSQ